MVNIHYSEEQANTRISRDIARFGVAIKSPWDFIHLENDPAWNLEIARALVNHLSEPYPDKVLEGLIYACARPQAANIVLPMLTQLLAKRGDDFVGQACADALVRKLEIKDIKILSDLLLDAQNGTSRALIIDRFAKLAKASSIPILKELTQDPNIGIVALQALAKIGDQSIRTDLQLLAAGNDSTKSILAQQALKRLNKKLKT